jgi:hypothetical protein
LLTDEPGRKEAKATIVTEVERLHWRIWNGRAKNAQKTFDRIRKVMHLYKGERRHRTRGVASRKLWHALHEIDKYLRSQSARLVNYAARYRAGMGVGTAVTGHREFPGQSPDKQVAADAPVSARRRPGTASPLRSLQRDAWFRLRSTVRTHRPSRCGCRIRRMIPPVSGHSL